MWAQGPIKQGSEDHYKNCGFYAKWDVQLLERFEMRKDVWFILCLNVIILAARLRHTLKEQIAWFLDKWNQNYNEVSPHTGQNGHYKKNLQIINTGEDAEKREPSCTVGGDINWYRHYGEQSGDSLKKTGIKLPYDSAIPLLGIYPEKTITEKDTCNPVFTAALFTIVMAQKQLDACQQKIDKKPWFLYTVEYNSAIKRMNVSSFWWGGWTWSLLYRVE